MAKLTMESDHYWPLFHDDDETFDDFLKLFNIPGGGKKWWNSLHVEKHQ